MNEIGIVSTDVFANKDNSVDFKKIIDSAKNIEYSNMVNNQLEYVTERYQELLEVYSNLEEKSAFDEVARVNELFYLHSMELGDSHLSSLADSFLSQIEKNDSISYASNIILNTKNIIENRGLKEVQRVNYVPNSIKYITSPTFARGDLNKYNLKNLHHILLEGTSLKDQNKDFRKDNNYFVGHVIDENTKYVDYFPPLAEYIDENVDLLLEFINDPCLIKEPNKHDEYLFLNPIIAQALFTVLQPFPDGNSRTARVLNSALMLKHTNSYYNKDLRYPVLYLSRSYYPLRKNYRELIKKIAVNPTNDTWNDWISFSLFSLEEYIDYIENLIHDSTLNKVIKKENL